MYMGMKCRVMKIKGEVSCLDCTMQWHHVLQLAPSVLLLFYLQWKKLYLAVIFTCFENFPCIERFLVSSPCLHTTYKIYHQTHPTHTPITSPSYMHRTCPTIHTYTCTHTYTHTTHGNSMYKISIILFNDMVVPSFTQI